ncbi:MAG: carboxymuconolactone decarboxylase family protein [Caulobacterales bacterium]
MSLDALRLALPPYANDLALNLESLAQETLLSDQQKWGVFVASAYAVGVPRVVKQIEAEAALAGLSDPSMTAAKGAAAIMGMNNVYFRALGFLTNPEYRKLPARLRMRFNMNPGVPQADYDLFCLAVSAINGCPDCLDAHEGGAKKRGVAPAAIQAAIRIAAVVNAVSRVIAGEDAAAS